MSAQDTERAAALERRYRLGLTGRRRAAAAIASWRGQVRRSSHALPA
jgi:hypothetical protein